MSFTVGQRVWSAYDVATVGTVVVATDARVEVQCDDGATVAGSPAGMRRVFLPSEQAALEQKVMKQLAESVMRDVDRVMLTPCVICGLLGLDHAEGNPDGCTGFVMPEEDQHGA